MQLCWRATGFAAATLNPFTIGIAQGIAELPIGSGIGLRIICFIAFQGSVNHLSYALCKKSKTSS